MIQIEVYIRKNTVTLTGYVTATARDSKLLPPSMTGAVTNSYEQIMPGTFGRALDRNREVAFKLNHERIIGKRGKELFLEEDAIGLKVRAVTDDPEVLAAAKAGKLTGWSWGMVIKRERPPDSLQQLLKAKGFDPNGIDGSFGAGCEKAVKAYQRAHKLTVDGSVGERTWRSLLIG